MDYKVEPTHSGMDRVRLRLYQYKLVLPGAQHARRVARLVDLPHTCCIGDVLAVHANLSPETQNCLYIA